MRVEMETVATLLCGSSAMPGMPIVSTREMEPLPTKQTAGPLRV